MLDERRRSATRRKDRWDKTTHSIIYIMDSICVYCGSSPGGDPVYAEIATDFTDEVVNRDLGLVYGGSIEMRRNWVGSAISVFLLLRGSHKPVRT